MSLQMQPAEEAVLQQVQQRIEPLTGISADFLHDISATTEHIPTSARQYAVVTLYVAATGGTGMLPADTMNAGSADAARNLARRDLADAQSALPDHLRRWLAASGNSPATELRPEDCLWYYEPVGHHFNCADCYGHGFITCPNCDGNRQVTCRRCDGAKTIQCLNCNFGRQKCIVCNGGGGQWVTRTRIVSNGLTHGDQESFTETYTEWVVCDPCWGSGTQTCQSCGGHCIITCPNCRGEGVVNCARCDARGILYCDTCARTGWRYERWDIQAVIDSEIRFSSITRCTEARHVIESLQNLREYCLLTQQVSPGDQCVRESSLERSFTGEVLISIVSLRIGGDTCEILGYGTPPRVFDYKNIVGYILQSRLQELEQALASVPRYLPVAGKRLNRTLAAFLAAPANQHIAIRPIDHPEKIARQDFQQAVSAAYVTRARCALHDAMQRIFLATLVPGIFLLFLFPAAVLMVAMLSARIAFGPIPVLIIAVISIGTALILDRFARWRLRRLVPTAPPDWTRFHFESSAKMRRSRQWLRITAVAGLLTGCLGTAMIRPVGMGRSHRPPTVAKRTKKPVRKPVLRISKSYRLAGKAKRTPTKMARTHRP